MVLGIPGLEGAAPGMAMRCCKATQAAPGVQGWEPGAGSLGDSGVL